MQATKRLASAHSAGIPGLWADIDVNGGPDGKTGAAESVEQALELAHAIVPPTIVVGSGYGVQAWWLLEDGPWVFGSTDERDQAATVTAAWTRLLRARAQADGFTIDSTHDLARLMRVPGTENAKGRQAGYQPQPVVILEEDGPRHTWETLARLASQAPAAAAPTPAAGGSGPLVLSADGNPPMDKLMVLQANDLQFDQTWKRQRREQWSSSEYDLSLATTAVKAEWTDQEIANLLIAHRRLHGGDVDKALRQDYVQRTLRKARTEQREAERTETLDQAVADLDQIAESGGGDPDVTIGAFNRLLGGPTVKEIIQDGRDPDTATFTLMLASGDPVRLGSGTNLLKIERFQERFMVVTGYVIPTVKRADWHRVVQALMTARVLRESTDDTPEGVVLEWLRRYLHERVSNDPIEAPRQRAPFRRDGYVYVVGDRLGDFVRSALRIRVTDPAVRDMLRHAGFERRTVAYETESGRRTSASYYAAPETEVLP